MPQRARIRPLPLTFNLAFGAATSQPTPDGAPCIAMRLGIFCNGALHTGAERA